MVTGRICILAAHEVNVARFLANLKPEYQAKDIQSASEETIVAEKNTVNEMAHEAGSECCSCVACAAFKRTKNKALFEGADAVISCTPLVYVLTKPLAITDALTTLTLILNSTHYYSYPSLRSILPHDSVSFS